jgi:hypothetical protein
MPDNRGWAIVSIMPRLANGVLIMVASILAVFLERRSMLASVLLTLFATCNLVDFVAGMSGIFRGSHSRSDIWRYQSHMCADVGRMRWFAAVAILFATGFVSEPVLCILGITG